MIIASQFYPDQRDASPEPPAYLEPRWILMMRRRLVDYSRTGNLAWYEERIKQDWKAVQ